MSGTLRDGRLNSEDITAGIITLAQKGVLTITPTGDGEKSDYVITYKHALTERDDFYYNILLSLLFLNPVIGQSIRLSSITKNRDAKIRNFYIFRNLKNNLYAKLVALGYMQELSMDDIFKGVIKRLLFTLLILILLATISIILTYSFGDKVPQINVPIVLVIILLVVPFIDMTLRQRSLTEKGALMKSELNGFYEYLAVAEKDRYESEKALDSGVLSWREFLPFAVAFGLVTQWDDSFSSIRSLRDETGRF